MCWIDDDSVLLVKILFFDEVWEMMEDWDMNVVKVMIVVGIEVVGNVVYDIDWEEDDVEVIEL